MWRDQCYDGFHFDRHKIYTAEQHQAIRDTALQVGTMLPGMMEMQLVQSLLNSVCYDSLQHIRDTHGQTDAQQANKTDSLSASTTIAIKQ